MKTNEDDHAASFGQLLRHDLTEPWMWLKPLTVGFLAFLLGQEGYVGVFMLIALCLSVAVTSGDLVRRTPWCGDTAFWRTRPVSRATLFAVKTAGFMLLCVIPAMAAGWLGFSDLDESTHMAVRCLGVAGLIALTAASAAASAIGSLGGVWRALGWQVVFGAPLLSFILLGVLQAYFPIPTPIGSGGLVSGMMVGLSLAALGSLAAWLVVGLVGKAKAAALILLVSGFSWPWVAGTFQGDFFKKVLPEHVVLKVEEGESFLRMPIQVVQLGEDEWFVPQEIRVSRKGERDFYSQAQVFRSGGMSLLPPAEVQVFSRDHRDFSAVMMIEKLWGIPRSTLPEHTNWIPTESTTDHTHTAFEMPELSKITSPDASIRLHGSRYRFLTPKPMNLNSKRMPVSVHDGLEVTKVGIPNANSIDVSLRMTRSVLEGAGQTESSWSVVPPEVWGILYHEESGTAYGTASWRARNRNNGLREVFMIEEDLVLRFELPRLESALLGLDPRKVLSGSMLYLFVVENLGPATAE